MQCDDCEKWRRLGEAQQGLVEDVVCCRMVSMSCDDPEDECDSDEEEVDGWGDRQSHDISKGDLGGGRSSRSVAEKGAQHAMPLTREQQASSSSSVSPLPLPLPPPPPPPPAPPPPPLPLPTLAERIDCAIRNSIFGKDWEKKKGTGLVHAMNILLEHADWNVKGGISLEPRSLRYNQLCCI